MPASNRGDFQALAEERLADAETLLTTERWSAAYYFSGYAVECALKACIAKLTREFDFPRWTTTDLYTHNLEKLVVTAQLAVTLGAAMAADAHLKLSWTLVKDWKVDARYDTKTQAEAEDMYNSVVAMLDRMREQW